MRANGASGWLRAKVSEVDGDPDRTAEVVGFVQLLHHVGAEERGEAIPSAGEVLGPPGVGPAILGEQSVEAARPSPGRSSTLEQHRVAHRERGRQRLRRRGAHQAIEGRQPHDSIPGGGFFFLDLADLLVLRGPSRRLAAALWFLDDVVRGRGLAWQPIVSKPARPARPPIWWNSCAVRGVDVPARRTWPGGEDHGADGHVDADAEVSVPQMTFSSPAWGCSTRTSVLGQHPAWCTPMPWRTNLGERPAEPDAARNPPMSSGDLVLLAEQVDAHQRSARSTADARAPEVKKKMGPGAGQQLVEHLPEMAASGTRGRGDGTGGG